jgi:putative ABC transport system permease protein
VRFWTLVGSALQALSAQKLRSALTIVSIMIGVGEVISMVGLVNGASDQIGDQIRRFGSDMIVVRPGSIVYGGAFLRRGSQPTLTEDDAWALREARGVRDVAPMVRSGAQVVSGNANCVTSIQGVTPEYLVLRQWAVVSGSAFTRADVEWTVRVAVLGQTVVDQLFGSEDPVGHVIRIRDVPFTVTGVLEAKGQTSWGDDLDDTILVPLSTAKERLGVEVSRGHPRSVNAILVRAEETADLTTIEEEITRLLRQRHRLRAEQSDDFWLQSFIEMFQALGTATGALTILLVGIAVISLLVGGLGIMNIMLVSVTERTREIGVRMAVGARRGDILRQFLVEALTLSLIGGALGVAAGVLAAHAVARFAAWRTLVPAEVVLLAFIFSGGVGLFFGFYPARRASRLQPIEALRYEQGST